MTAEDIAAALSDAPVALADACAPAAAGGIPTAPGFYAWWAEPACIEELPHIPHPAEPALGLFYIGISPRDEKSAQTLRGRVVGQHLGGNTSSSTFRFVLAALLLDDLALMPRATAKKYTLDADDNRRLREWQQAHLRLTWCVRERPWEIEPQVIALMRPPLNSAGNAGHPFYERARAARAAFRTAARDTVPKGAADEIANSPVPRRQSRLAADGEDEQRSRSW
jgi:hypothetical protein